MDSAWTSIIVFVLSVFVLIFFVGQAFFAGGEKVTTETAFTYSMTEDIPFEGVFLRDETVIHNSGTGVVDYEHSDGSKVGKSSVIARRYRSEADIERRSEIEKINEQIAVLTDAQRLAGTDNNQLETISSQINERHSLILESLIDGSGTGKRDAGRTVKARDIPRRHCKLRIKDKLPEEPRVTA